ncbi:hypothetical protein Tco_0429385, partial [Tanacetum coccineum]
CYHAAIIVMPDFSDIMPDLSVVLPVLTVDLLEFSVIMPHLSVSFKCWYAQFKCSADWSVVVLDISLVMLDFSVVWALAAFPTPTAYAPCAERLALTTVVRGAVTAHFAPRRGAVARNACQNPLVQMF